ncbi:PAS domain-containing sensor histidine kinase [candidate division WOR-3 bacterium]|nr:PAS domain-containing sensor histidine kinase [candidate division WOR-3 bacterium]
MAPFYISLITFASSVNSLSEMFIFRKKSGFWVLNLVIDSFCASFVIVLSGGTDSSLYMLFFLVILVYTMKKGAKAAWFSLSITMMFYLVLLFFQRYGVYYYWDGNLMFFRNTPAEDEESYIYFTQFLYALISSLIISAMSVWMEEKSASKTKQLEYVRHTTDDILRSMQEGLLTVNSVFETVFVNPSFILFSGLGNLSPGAKVPDKARKWLEENNYSIDLVGLDGKKRNLKCDLNEIKDQKGKVIGRIMVLNDITEILEKDKKINEINQLAVIGEMSANIAHELRNPLASIRVSIDLLSKNIEENVNEVARIAKTEIDRINKMIEDFLSFSKLPDPKMKIFGLRDVVGDVVKAFSMARQDVIVEAKLCPPEWYIFADKNQFKQVLFNLMGNAYKAARDSDEKRIDVKTVRIEEKIVISVKDSGVGIRPQSLSKIFNPFFTESGEGSGLGLSIVKKIAAMHGWEVRVESEEGRGSEFFVIIEGFEERKTSE